MQHLKYREQIIRELILHDNKLFYKEVTDKYKFENKDSGFQTQLKNQLMAKEHKKSYQTNQSSFRQHPFSR